MVIEKPTVPIHLFMHMNSCSVCRFWSDLATPTGRLLGATTYLPHSNGGIPLSALPKDTTSKLVGKLTVPVIIIR